MKHTFFTIIAIVLCFICCVTAFADSVGPLDGAVESALPFALPALIIIAAAITLAAIIILIRKKRK